MKKKNSIAILMLIYAISMCSVFGQTVSLYNDQLSVVVIPEAVGGKVKVQNITYNRWMATGFDGPSSLFTYRYGLSNVVSDSQVISLESAKYPGYYLVAQKDRSTVMLASLSANDGADFRKRATWIKRRFYSSQHNKNYNYYESAEYLGYIMFVNQADMKIGLMAKGTEPHFAAHFTDSFDFTPAKFERYLHAGSELKDGEAMLAYGGRKADSPSSSILTINYAGNLVVYDGFRGTVIWSAMMDKSIPKGEGATVKMKTNGDLVLYRIINGVEKPIWGTGTSISENPNWDKPLFKPVKAQLWARDFWIMSASDVTMWDNNAPKK